MLAREDAGRAADWARVRWQLLDPLTGPRRFGALAVARSPRSVLLFSGASDAGSFSSSAYTFDLGRRLPLSGS
jgi:hypothetical protein